MLLDVLFLDRHPAWSWTDLMDAPDDVIEAMRLLDREKAKHRA